MISYFGLDSDMEQYVVKLVERACLNGEHVKRVVRDTRMFRPTRRRIALASQPGCRYPPPAVPQADSS